MRDEPNARLRCRNARSSDTTAPRCFCGVQPPRGANCSPGDPVLLRGQVFDLRGSPRSPPVYPPRSIGLPTDYAKAGRALSPGVVQDIIGRRKDQFLRSSAKSVSSSRQPDGGHGSRNPLRSVLPLMLHTTANLLAGLPPGGPVAAPRCLDALSRCNRQWDHGPIHRLGGAGRAACPAKI